MQFLTYVLYLLLAGTSFFLICLILIQRGKGGGLAGAFGGVGGSSAFGTKAGDIFTRVTMITAGIWITLNMLLVVLTNQRPSAFGPNTPASSSGSSAPGVPKVSTDLDAPKDKDKGKSTGDAIEPSAGKPAAAGAKPSTTGNVPDTGPTAPRSADLPDTPVIPPSPKP